MSKESGSKVNVKLRFAGLAIILAMGAQAGAFYFFLEDGAKISGIKVSGDDEYFGWISQVIAIFFGAVGMFISLHPSADEDEG